MEKHQPNTNQVDPAERSRQEEIDRRAVEQAENEGMMRQATGDVGAGPVGATSGRKSPQASRREDANAIPRR
jgi:hypothetical protein